MMSSLRLGQKQMIVTVGYASDSDKKEGNGLPKMKVTKFEIFKMKWAFPSRSWNLVVSMLKLSSLIGYKWFSLIG